MVSRVIKPTPEIKPEKKIVIPTIKDPYPSLFDDLEDESVNDWEDIAEEISGKLLR